MKYKLLPGARLREIREKLGLTQLDLSIKTGFSQTMISQAENDSGKFKVVNAKLMLLAYYMLKDIDVYNEWRKENEKCR